MVLCRGADAATSFNAQSALGMNLNAVNYYATEQPFINAFVSSEHWTTHANGTWDTNEEQYLDLDPNGWPMSLKSVNEPRAQRFDSVGVIFLLGMPDTANGIYPSGHYSVLYDGQGTLSYGSDAALIRRSPGRDIIDVTPSNHGIELRIIATDPRHDGSYLRNIRVVTAANEAAVKAGQVFNPAFLNILRNFRVLRFMDWFQTNGSTLAAWTDRALPGNAFYGTSKGVPIEIAILLANAVSADAWMNVPVMADDGFIRQMAVLVHDSLGSNQKIYLELSNEVWNLSFSQAKYAAAQGRALWPTRTSRNAEFDYNREWFGMRTAQMCDIWRSVWGSDPRLVCVLGAQAAWSPSATQALDCPYWSQGAPCSGHGIDAVAIAPYMGGSVPEGWTLKPDWGLANIFESLYKQNDRTIPAGGFIGQASAWVKDYVKILAPYKLSLVAYEGGQTFANGATDTLNHLYMAANRDPRMSRAYADYLEQWKIGGGQLFIHFNDVGVEGKYGSWGALESIMQSTEPLSSAPPKWQGIQEFISTRPCWWPGCSGAVDAGDGPTVPVVKKVRHIH